MIVLGISDSLTSGAAMVIDGQIAAAVNEERLNRLKMSMGFPMLSIAEVIRLSGVNSGEIDAVAVATKNLFWRPESVPFPDYFRKKKGGQWDIFLALGAKLSTIAGNSTAARKIYYNLKSTLTGSRHDKVRVVLKEKFGINAPVTFLDHHLCHASSAYYTSGYDDATVITQDGAGDGKCSRVYRVKNGVFEELNSMDSYDSIGNYYAYVTHLCGYKAHKHEGKITGLAAFGKPGYLEILREFITYADGVISNRGKCFDHSALEKLQKRLPTDFSHKDLSATIQILLEENVAGFCNYWIGKSGIQNVALAGGVFANVKLNQRINELDSVTNIFVHPGMGDDGLSVGAALFRHFESTGYKQQPVIKDVYLGGEYSDSEIMKAIDSYNCRPQQYDSSIEHKVAELLADGKVVARFNGRMEYGPRALGNRTIMYQPTDRSVNEWLNQRLVRTEFMPFAPVTLWEERDKCFHGLKGAAETARFMTVTFDCTDTMIKTCPAVCHIDGTARPQLIREEDNPSYYRIVKEYQAMTGLPCVINTSFNMHEEPIVNTPGDAVRSFLEGHLDYLAIGNYILKHEGNIPEGKKRETDSIGSQTS